MRRFRSRSSSSELADWKTPAGQSKCSKGSARRPEVGAPGTDRGSQSSEPDPSDPLLLVRVQRVIEHAGSFGAGSFGAAGDHRVVEPDTRANVTHRVLVDVVVAET